MQTADFAGGINNSGKMITVLQPLWSILPSPEARAAKFSNKNSRSFRTGSPVPNNSSHMTPSSRSDLEVHALKSLCNSMHAAATTIVHLFTYDDRQQDVHHRSVRANLDLNLGSPAR